MVKFFLLIFFFLALTLTALGQERKRPTPQDTSYSQPRMLYADSAFAGRESLPPLSLEQDYGVFPDSITRWYMSPYRIDSWLSAPKFYHPAPESYGLLLREFPYDAAGPTDLRLQSDSWMLQSKKNLLAPWRLELQSQEKYQIWRSILGSVQIGGAAYLLYLHLKKYGLK